MNAYKTIAVRAANRAGDFIAKAFANRDRIIAQSKGTNDFVSNIDEQAEQLIIDTIHKSYPDHAIFAEESGHQGKSDVEWVIDQSMAQPISYVAFPISVFQLQYVKKARQLPQWFSIHFKMKCSVPQKVLVHN